MEISEYRNIFFNENSHFLYTSRHNLVISLIKKFINVKNDLKILDAGCGTGGLAKKLQKFGKVLAIDINPEAIKFARKRGIQVKKASILDLPFKNNSFDLVVSIDVLYHKKVSNDLKALSEIFRVLRPTGILILRVPANKQLHLSHDTHVHTRQRYSKNELEKKLTKVGFTIKKISFVNSILLPLAYIKQVKEGLFKEKQTGSVIVHNPGIINNLFDKILSLEIYIIKKINLPFGIGLIAVCSKPLGDKISSGKKRSKQES